MAYVEIPAKLFLDEFATMLGLDAPVSSWRLALEGRFIVGVHINMGPTDTVLLEQPLRRLSRLAPLRLPMLYQPMLYQQSVKWRLETSIILWWRISAKNWTMLARS
jgi:hypothetical protein